VPSPPTQRLLGRYGDLASSSLLRPVSVPLENYALIGDSQCAALVSSEGSIDWLCFPRFDSPACFAALLGDSEHGRWLIAPRAEPTRVRRRYQPGSLILETEIETGEGAVRLVDFMSPRRAEPDVVRIVQGMRGTVSMHTELVIRFDYGSIVPWVRRRGNRLHAIAGPDALFMQSDAPLRGEKFRTLGDFSVGAGEELAFVLTWYPSSERPPDPRDARALLAEAQSWWREWTSACRYDGAWKQDVLDSLAVLKGLTYASTGGILAAPTTSLPEQLGGQRNWDYRFCWVRDATYTLMALMEAGYVDEARAWRDWLLRAVAGNPEALQIMYGPAGERRLTEYEIDWLPGYEGSKPVRIGNAAASQFQLDVYGELMDALHQTRLHELEPAPYAWSVQKVLLDFLEGAWREPDEGIWEPRGGRRHFVHSKVMAWVAFDRAVAAVERFGLGGRADRWRATREEIRAEVLRRGFDAERGTFVQAYGSRELDAALLRLPLVGFLPARDRRVMGTVDAIRRELCDDGFVLRYRTRESLDGLPEGEGAFLACTFWLVDCLALQGRRDQAVELFERLLSVRNDVGLLAEEYDLRAGRQVGNFPQAFSHVGLVNSAANLSRGLPAPGD
jgi:GH15 family glucan-1,4-alpha-glucosidase